MKKRRKIQTKQTLRSCLVFWFIERTSKRLMWWFVRSDLPLKYHSLDMKSRKESRSSSLFYYDEQAGTCAFCSVGCVQSAWIAEYKTPSVKKVSIYESIKQQKTLDESNGIVENKPINEMNANEQSNESPATEKKSPLTPKRIGLIAFPFLLVIGILLMPIRVMQNEKPRR